MNVSLLENGESVWRIRLIISLVIFSLVVTLFTAHPQLLTRKEKRKKEHKGSLVLWIVACYCILLFFPFLITEYMFKNHTNYTKNCLEDWIYPSDTQYIWNICLLHKLELKHKALSIYLDLEAICSSTSYWHLGFAHYVQQAGKKGVLPHSYSSSYFPKCVYKHTCPSTHQSFVVILF